MLEFCEKGELYQILRTQKCRRFTEPIACNFFVQVVDGLHYLHQKSVVHRDIKPENLLVDHDGCLKIADFGWCAVSNILRTTFCGTLDYLAPEMIQGKGHDHTLDIWSAGVLLYEMVVGRPPFQSTNHAQLISKILTLDLRFPPFASAQVQDLIRNLLRRDPRERICLPEVLRHEWVRQFIEDDAASEQMDVKDPRSEVVEEPKEACSPEESAGFTVIDKEKRPPSAQRQAPEEPPAKPTKSTRHAQERSASQPRVPPRRPETGSSNVPGMLHQGNSRSPQPRSQQQSQRTGSAADKPPGREAKSRVASGQASEAPSSSNRVGSGAAKQSSEVSRSQETNREATSPGTAYRMASNSERREQNSAPNTPVQRVPFRQPLTQSPAGQSRQLRTNPGGRDGRSEATQPRSKAPQRESSCNRTQNSDEFSSVSLNVSGRRLSSSMSPSRRQADLGSSSGAAHGAGSVKTNVLASPSAGHRGLQSESQGQRSSPGTSYRTVASEGQRSSPGTSYRTLASEAAQSRSSPSTTYRNLPSETATGRGSPSMGHRNLPSETAASRSSPSMAYRTLSSDAPTASRTSPVSGSRVLPSDSSVARRSPMVPQRSRQDRNVSRQP